MQDMKTVKVQVHLVATKEKSGLFAKIMTSRGYSVLSPELEYSDNPTFIRNIHLINSGKAATNGQAKYKFYTICFTTDDDIRQGDVYYNSMSGEIYRCNAPKMSKQAGINRKVIVSTDANRLNKLRLQEFKTFETINKPTEAFVKAYVSLYDGSTEIKETLLKLEGNQCNCVVHDDEKGCFHCDYSGIDYWKIAVNDHNEVTTKSVKKSWNKEELDMQMNLIIRDILTFQKDPKLLRSPSSNNIAQFVIDWTAENL